MDQHLNCSSSYDKLKKDKYQNNYIYGGNSNRIGIHLKYKRSKRLIFFFKNSDEKETNQNSTSNTRAIDFSRNDKRQYSDLIDQSETRRACKPTV